MPAKKWSRAVAAAPGLGAERGEGERAGAPAAPPAAGAGAAAGKRSLGRRIWAPCLCLYCKISFLAQGACWISNLVARTPFRLLSLRGLGKSDWPLCRAMVLRP